MDELGGVWHVRESLAHLVMFITRSRSRRNAERQLEQLLSNFPYTKSIIMLKASDSTFAVEYCKYLTFH